MTDTPSFNEITRDGFEEADRGDRGRSVDVVVVQDIDELTRSLLDWNAVEKAYVRHGVRSSTYCIPTEIWTCPRRKVRIRVTWRCYALGGRAVRRAPAWADRAPERSLGICRERWG